MVPPGDVFGVIPIWIAVYLAAAVAFGLSATALYTRLIRQIRLGRAAGRSDRPLVRLRNAVIVVLGQRRVLQSVSLSWRDLAGLGHAAIFFGFLSMVLSYVILDFGDTIWRGFSEWLFTERGVEVFSYYIDVVVLVILAAILWGVLRRWVARPHRLTFDLTRSRDSVVIVGLIALLMVLTLLTEAAFVAAGGTGPAATAPVGAAMGRGMEGLGITGDVANTLHGLFWWAHLLVILGFAMYIPYSKHMHMVAAPLNAFFRRLGPTGTLPDMPDLETAESFGAGRLQDLTWKELLDGYACAVCGRCSDACPANQTGKVLSPMHIVEGIKEHLLEEAPRLLKGEAAEKPLIGAAVQEQAVWDCLTCGACVAECPVTVEHIDSIVDMRRYLVMEQSQMPDTAQSALLSLEQRGHPWRGTTFTRTDWAEGLEVPTMADSPGEVEVLFWVGCTGALEQRSQAVPRAMASVLKVAGVRFAILGNEETCTGDPARRMGNEYLYQILAQQNIETLNGYGVRKIVTICPHCFNNIKNEYPQLGGNFEVVHYTEFVADLIKQGRLRPLRAIQTTISYHDSCYLSRHNGIQDPPREIIKAIPGLELKEIPQRNRRRTFCCGAGGGHMWMEEAGDGPRVNHARTDQFLDAGAEMVGVSCPYCLQMMTDGISSKGKEGSRYAVDLLELLVQSVGQEAGDGG